MNRTSLRSRVRAVLPFLAASVLIVPNAGCLALMGAVSGASGETVSNLAQADLAIATVVASGVAHAARSSDQGQEPVEEPLPDEDPRAPIALGFPLDENGRLCPGISVALRRRVPHRVVQPWINERRLMVVRLTPEEEEAFLVGSGLDFDVCGRLVFAQRASQLASR